MPVIKFKGLEVVTVTFENRNNCRVFLFGRDRCYLRIPSLILKLSLNFPSYESLIYWMKLFKPSCCYSVNVI